MEQCQRTLRHAGHEFGFRIHAEDFVLSRARGSLFDSEQPDVFDAVVMNPPYCKIAKDSPHARKLEDIVHGQPNIYAMFMAVAADLLRPGGWFVAITPRSYCNGLYFREFRHWFFQRMALRQLHLFESRKAAFQESEVLQESLITIAMRRQPDEANLSNVIVTTSIGRDLANVSERRHPTGTILDNAAGDRVVRIPVAPFDRAIIRAVESWSSNFVDRGLRISTGPVVTFRAREYLLVDAECDEAVPLLSVHNVRPFKTVWPVAKGNKPVAFRACPASKSLVLPSRNYVLLRRFSAKEEARRLTASCFIPSLRDRKRAVALENHINYIYLDNRELTEAETVGLASLFNSALLDRYFRVISGNTQVNATEIRTMPFPNLTIISCIGDRVRKIDSFARSDVERAVLEELGINGAISRELLRAPP